MDDDIRGRLGKTGRTSVVCRTGVPMDVDDLDIARLETSRAIVILSPETDDPDADVIKTMLAVTNHPRRRPEPYHIVAELHDPGNLDVARLVGGTEAQLILAGDLISRITAQTCRQAGLSIVYTELLDFDGDEIYFATLPELVGPDVRGRAARVRGLDAHRAPAGRRRRRSSTRRWTRSSAPATRLIVVSADDDTVRLAGDRAGGGRGGRSGPSSRPLRPRSGRSSSAGTGGRRRSSASSTATWRRGRRSSSRRTSARRSCRSRT